MLDTVFFSQPIQAMKKDRLERPIKKSVKSGEYSLASASGLTYVAPHWLAITAKATRQAGD
jgi:hypothetical protein